MKAKDLINKTWRDKWGRRAVIALGISLIFSTLVRCDGPYKGRLIDEETGQPIQGALALGYWSVTIPNPGGGTSHCLDARETVSDEKGNFNIPISAFGEILGSMKVALYKVGYERMGPGPWESFKESRYLIERVKWEDGRVIIPLKQVANEKFNSEIGSPPHISCGRRDGEPLFEYIRMTEEYWQAVKKTKSRSIK
jgi:hypothetical protein